MLNGLPEAQVGVIDIGSRRELFVDRKPHRPTGRRHPETPLPQLTPRAPGSFRGAYNTVIKDGRLYRRYYGESGRSGAIHSDTVCTVKSRLLH